jgi:putative mRNA 3-end processing factor
VTGTSQGLLRSTPQGWHCPAAGIHIDPRRPVPRAVITHAHADHPRGGCGAYLATPESARLLKARLGPDITVQELPYGTPLAIGPLRLSLHPAGHLLGSAQVRLARGGEVWVATGDFKRDPDPTCAPFEPLRCHTLLTECTFGLPVFRWPAPQAVMAAIGEWWRDNAAAGRPSLLMAYSLGKAQRLLAGIDATIGPILVHDAIEQMTQLYREAGIGLPPTRPMPETGGKGAVAGALVLAPPAADGSAWMRRAAGASRAFASGWMQIRGNRRRRALDRGFVLSDHADWGQLLETIRESGAERILLTHGYAPEMERFLTERGFAAEAVDAAPGSERETFEA